MRRLIPFLFTLSVFTGSLFAQQNPIELTIVGPEGWRVQILHGAPGTLPPVVLQGDEVLYPGHLDCDLAQGHPQCRSLALLLGSEPENQQSAPGVIVINAGGAAILLDVIPSAYPPPVVIVDDCVVTYWVGNCPPPGPNHLQVVDATGEIILFHQDDAASEPAAVLLNQEVLNPADVNCGQSSGQWECLWASGAIVHWSDQGSWPDAVSSPEANVLVDFTVSDAPPPIVYKDGNVLNR